MKKTKSSTSKRRIRNPDATRESILKAARTVLAEDGPDGLKVSRVAHLAGVNRGTAYQHFQTREDLARATAESVGHQLSMALFGSEDENIDVPPPTEQPVTQYIERLATFAVENPELGRVWLFETLASEDPSQDLFFKQFRGSLENLTDSEVGQNGVDTEALAVILLAGYFLWPVWVQSHTHDKKRQARMAHRLSREVLRLSMYGVFKPEYYPQLVELLEKDDGQEH
jgi:AcrR family transcriptional regulator